MPEYEIRTNCEYVLFLEAASEEEALAIADKTPYGEWDQAWAEWTAEELPEEREVPDDAA